jgi:hypothetical protein
MESGFFVAVEFLFRIVFRECMARFALALFVDPLFSRMTGASFGPCLAILHVGFAAFRFFVFLDAWFLFRGGSRKARPPQPPRREESAR